MIGQQRANAASVALVREGRVLLIERARAPYAGLWTLPGGRLEAGETAAAAAVREVREELGLQLHELDFVTQLRSEHWELAVFVSSAFAGAVTPSDEIAGWMWCDTVAATALPRTPGLLEVLELCLRATSDPA